jgi:hypothetical protein
VAGGPVLSAFGTNGGVALGAGDLTAGNTYIAMFNDFHGVFVVNAQTPVTSQGSWVPVLAGSSVAGTPVYTTQAGSYEQIGRQVTARFSIITSAITGISGDVRVAGLPFANNATDIGIGFISCFSGWTGTAGFTTIGGVVDGSQTFMRIQESGNGVNSPNAIAAHFAATTALLGVVFYHV